MIQEAFDCSEKYGTPVLFRPTTRVCHAYASVTVPDEFVPRAFEGFIRDTGRWVIFPRLSYASHGKMEQRNLEIGKDFSGCRFNSVEGAGSEKAVFASGVSYAYAKECLKDHPEIRLVRIGTPFPFPEDFALQALSGVREALVLEELSPFVEEQLLMLAGRHHLPLIIHGKLDGTVPHNGENSVELSAGILSRFLELPLLRKSADLSGAPALPVRPPVLCAGCPHRASFYAVKRAVQGRKAFFCGDIGCYTLGNAQPLDMVDTCLCMGAGITMAQGLSHLHPDALCFAFVGDSTFFASGMTGVVNAVHNEADIILCVLDNSTTAMTGHQPHPGTGRNMMGRQVEPVDIARVLKGIGVPKVLTVDPLDLDAALRAVEECAAEKGVRAILFKSPCIALSRPAGKSAVNPDLCISCKKCIREIGCPALIASEDCVRIDPNLCTGCGLCARICPVGAIGGEQHE